MLNYSISANADLVSIPGHAALLVIGKLPDNSLPYFDGRLRTVQEEQEQRSHAFLSQNMF